MDNHLASTPTCTLKMNLLCCDDCPKKLKKKLQKMNGVKNVNIDRQQGLVTISSNIDPVILREKIIKMGKRAELLSFHKHPIASQNKAASSSSKTKSYIQTGKDCSCEGHENTTTSNEDDNDQNTLKNKNNSLLTWQRPEQSTKDKKKNKKVMPMPGTIPRPMMNSVGHMSLHGPFRPPYGRLPLIHRSPVQTAYANGYGPYGYYYRPRPWAPAFSYYGSGSPPRVNPMVHYTSYEDNYRPH